MSSIEIPTLIKVTSSNIDSLAYEESTEFLYVRFKGKTPDVQGPLWRYSGVPRQKGLGIRSAFSIGKYFYAQIKGQYPASKIE